LILAIKQFEIWIADLNQQIGTEPGKIIDKKGLPGELVCYLKNLLIWLKKIFKSFLTLNSEPPLLLLPKK